MSGYICSVFDARWFAAAGVVVGLAGCASQLHRAPVEDRTVGTRAPQPFVAPVPTGDASSNGGRPEAGRADTGRADTGRADNGRAADAGRPLAPVDNTENAGKPGFYTVKQGDTLLRVALETGQNWRDIQRWNNLDNSHVLQIGEVLRVVPLNQDPGVAVTRPITPAGGVDARNAEASRVPLAAPPALPLPAPVAAAPAPAPAPAPIPAGAGNVGAGSDEDLGWIWPASGSVVAGFDEARTKGMLIAGSAGDPVVAAADGRVVYAGSGLRGYGNLVIIKHNNTYLTAYAHNKTLLVREDQPVKRGQKIAEMGSTDAQRVQLHFEVRRQGKPIDPSRVLPPR
jgi:lipoprotein NlpD